MIKKTISSIVLATTLTFAVQVQAELAATVTLTSDYVFNGVSQSDGDSALQANAYWYNDSGFYVGYFASQVDYTNYGLPDAELEFDVYVGYGNSINEDLSFDVGYAYFTYPGVSDDGFESNYGEINGSLTYKENTTVKFAYSNDYSFEVGGSYYMYASHSFSLPQEISLKLEASYTKLLEDDNGQDAYWFGSDNITHWGVSLNKSISGFDFSLSYTDTDADSDPSNLADGRAFLSVSRSFY